MLTLDLSIMKSTNNLVYILIILITFLILFIIKQRWDNEELSKTIKKHNEDYEQFKDKMDKQNNYNEELIKKQNEDYEQIKEKMDKQNNYNEELKKQNEDYKQFKDMMEKQNKDNEDLIKKQNEENKQFKEKLEKLNKDNEDLIKKQNEVKEKLEKLNKDNEDLVKKQNEENLNLDNQIKELKKQVNSISISSYLEKALNKNMKNFSEKKLSVLERQYHKIMNSYKILYFRKMSNLILDYLFKTYGEMFAKTDAIFTNDNKPGYKKIKFPIICVAKSFDKILEVEKYLINLIIDFLMYMKDFTSSIIHLSELSYSIQIEILSQYIGHKMDKIDNKYYITSYELINLMFDRNDADNKIVEEPNIQQNLNLDNNNNNEIETSINNNNKILLKKNFINTEENSTEISENVKSINGNSPQSQNEKNGVLEMVVQKNNEKIDSNNNNNETNISKNLSELLKEGNNEIKDKSTINDNKSKNSVTGKKSKKKKTKKKRRHTIKMRLIKQMKRKMKLQWGKKKTKKTRMTMKKQTQTQKLKKKKKMKKIKEKKARTKQMTKEKMKKTKTM